MISLFKALLILNYIKNKLVILKIKYSILGFFQLVLKVFLKFTLDIINKSLKISKIFLKQGFKFWPYNKTDIVIIIGILSSLKIDNIIKK